MDDRTNQHDDGDASSQCAITDALHHAGAASNDRITVADIGRAVMLETARRALAALSMPPSDAGRRYASAGRPQ